VIHVCAVVVVVNWSKVFLLNVFSGTTFWSILAQSWVILVCLAAILCSFRLLWQYWRLSCIIKFRSITTSRYDTWGVIVWDLDRTSKTIWNDMLRITVIWDLGWVMIRSTLTHPLNSGNYLLVLWINNSWLLEWILFNLFTLSDLQFQYPLVWSISTLWTSSNASVAIIVNACLSLACYTYMTLSTFAWVNSSGHTNRVLNLRYLVYYLQLLEAIIQIWALSFSVACFLSQMKFYTAIHWVLAVWTIVCIIRTFLFIALAVGELLIRNILLLLDLFVELSELHIVRLIVILTTAWLRLLFQRKL